MLSKSQRYISLTSAVPVERSVSKLYIRCFISFVRLALYKLFLLTKIEKLFNLTV